MQKYQRLIVALPADEYRKLAAIATRDTREPDQQVRHYIRRALSRQRMPQTKTEVGSDDTA